MAAKDLLTRLEAMLGSSGRSDSARLVQLLGELMPGSNLLRAVRETSEACAKAEEIGEIAGVLAHQFADFLNLLLLQASVLKHLVEEESREDLAELTRQGNAAAELLRRFQEHRRGTRPPPDSFDINVVVVEEIEGCSNVESGLAPSAMIVSGVRADVRRLLRFLIRNAMSAVVPNDGRVVVRTCMRENVVVEVEDSGPSPAGDAEDVFDPLRAGREGTDSLELAACRSIVRRLEGGIRAEVVEDGGLRIVVELPSAARA